MLRPSTFVLALSCTALGCASQGIYTSPRTIAPGRLQHNAFVEFQAVSRGSGSGVYPIPALGYMARYGLARQIEGGARVTVLGVFGIDLKLQLVRSRGFDFAVDPSAVTAWTVGYLHLPLVAGINLSPSLQVLLGARYSYGFALLRGIGGSIGSSACVPSVSSTMGLEIRDLAVCDSTVGAMAGFRYVTGSARSGIALQPEYNISRTIAGNEEVTLHTFALSVSFGALPPFSPEDEQWESRETGAAPPARPVFPPPPPPPADPAPTLGPAPTATGTATLPPPPPP